MRDVIATKTLLGQNLRPFSRGEDLFFKFFFSFFFGSNGNTERVEVGNERLLVCGNDQ